LVLIDAGAEYGYYAGDITRTFPVNGRFTGAQKAVYEIVLEANKQAIAAIAPNVLWQEVSDVALKILVQGMVDLKLLHGNVEDNIATQAYRRFYMHGIGHWIGLDVHDVGGRFHQGQARQLRENMCTTVEPGLYIQAADDIPPEFHNIGIRIEDNVRVSASAAEVYTTATPKEIGDIEALMRENK
jgi:Xaa-Pro aminopeptidase